VNRYLEIARSVIAGRRWLVAMDVAQPVARTMNQLMELGAADVFGVGGCMGTGAMPDVHGHPLEVLDLHGEGTMGGIRAAERGLSQLPAGIVDRVNLWDPAREALAIRPFFSGGAPVAGRATWGARPALWQALEDKVVIDAFWRAAGISCAAHRVVTPEEAADTSTALDRGDGTVWAGDAREGFNGGATYTFWVRTPDDGARALAYLGPRCDRVRVMPFLEGLPCSIHGIVVPHDPHIVTLRPMEMLVLRGPEGFVYCGGGGTWRPHEEHRRQMRSVARRAGEHLRSVYGYRGAFTVDGVLTEDGFLPTELNPRYGAAMRPYESELPLMLLIFAMIAREPVDWRAEELEAILLNASATAGSIVAGIPSVATATEDRALSAIFDPECRLAGPEEEPHVALTLGPSPGGSYLRMVFDPKQTPVGPSLAPRVAALANLAAERWGLPVDGLSPAPEFT